LGQKVNVLNRPGGGQSVALTQFAEEAPNGHMFFFGALTGVTMQPQLSKAITYSVDNYEYAGCITEFQPAMIIPIDREYSNMKEFVAWAKKADRVKYAALSPGAKMIMQVIAAQEGLTNVDYIPTRGGREMMQLIISQQVDFAYSGGLHAKYPDQAISVAAATSERLQTDPEVPTLIELGYNTAADAPTVILFPKGTRQSIIDKMEAALKVASTHPDMEKVSKAISYPIKYCSAADSRKIAKKSWNTIETMIKETGYEAK
jgi:tripartite-type tricarboxylate transporter receptor subunit TctC